jgi:hypothetical protein
MRLVIFAIFDHFWLDFDQKLAFSARFCPKSSIYGKSRPYILGNGIDSRTCGSLQTQATNLSKPNPKPA